MKNIPTKHHSITIRLDFEASGDIDQSFIQSYGNQISRNVREFLAGLFTSGKIAMPFVDQPYIESRVIDEA